MDSAFTLHLIQVIAPILAAIISAITALIIAWHAKQNKTSDGHFSYQIDRGINPSRVYNLIFLIITLILLSLYLFMIIAKPEIYAFNKKQYLPGIFFTTATVGVTGILVLTYAFILGKFGPAFFRLITIQAFIFLVTLNFFDSSVWNRLLLWTGFWTFGGICFFAWLSYVSK